MLVFIHPGRSGGAHLHSNNAVWTHGGLRDCWLKSQVNNSNKNPGEKSLFISFRENRAPRGTMHIVVGHTITGLPHKLLPKHVMNNFTFFMEIYDRSWHAVKFGFDTICFAVQKYGEHVPMTNGDDIKALEICKVLNQISQDASKVSPFPSILASSEGQRAKIFLFALEILLYQRYVKIFH